jgi:RNA-directed DNA polymerase
MPIPQTDAAAVIGVNGQPLMSADDVADYFAISRARMIHALYRAGDETRYREFEIPKRTGGMRRISAPRGLVRELQSTLNPALQKVYAAHPAAHGFISQRSVVSNASPHAGKHWVLNVDLADFFPSINFGRVRGLFMAPPFNMGPKAASVMAQICVHGNGLPQGAPTSPVLSNFIAASLDRRLMRLAKEMRCDYTRYADDITFSCDLQVFPPALAMFDVSANLTEQVQAGDALERAIMACGFAINQKKVRLQGRHRHQSVTGLCVNRTANVERTRIRKVRAMLHAWDKFGLNEAGREHFEKYARTPGNGAPADAGAVFRSSIYGQLAFIKMVRGASDPVFLNLCARLIDLDPNPSTFIRQMVFGAADYDVFISHASEDKAEIARPIYAACEKLGLKVFLDEDHIGWGESFTKKINTALGAARTILVVVSSQSVSKEWPLAEINTALGFEVDGKKTVIPLMVGKPDLTHLPLIRSKRWIDWSGDPMAVAREVAAAVRRRGATDTPAASTNLAASVPQIPIGSPHTEPAEAAVPPADPNQSWLRRLFR